MRIASPARTFPACCAALLLLGACAAPRAGLWPPPPGVPSYPVTVYQSTFHSEIELPAAIGFERWSYVQKIWWESKERQQYEEFTTQWTLLQDAFQALFRPGAGVIVYDILPAPTAESEPAEYQRCWRFQVSPEGLRRMRAYLNRSRGSMQPIDIGRTQWDYPAATRYHVFNTCHHFVAEALWEGGIPVRRASVLLPVGMWTQLSRLTPPRPVAVKP